MSQVKDALVVNYDLLSEMVSDYIYKTEGRRVSPEDLDLMINLADSQVESWRQGVRLSTSVFTATWDKK